MSKGTCSADNAPAVGMESRAIPDSSITASVYYSKGYEPYNARLNIQPGGGSYGVWAGKNRADEYLQVDLGKLKDIRKVATQGRANKNQWVKRYKLQYSVDGSQWIWDPKVGWAVLEMGPDGR